jgi:hypothetical protein
MRKRQRTRAPAQHQIDEGETHIGDARGMEPPRYQVIVVRAWHDAGGLRIRLLADGGSARQWVVGSIAEARDLLGAILAELTAPARPDQPDSPQRP